MVKKNRALPGPRKNTRVKNTPMKKAARVLTSLGRGVKSVATEAAHVGRQVAAAGGRAWGDYSDWARAQNIKAAEHNLAMTELRLKKRNLMDEMPEMVSGDEGGGPGWDGMGGDGRYPLAERRMPAPVRRFVPATPVGYPSFHEPPAPSVQHTPQAGQTIQINVGQQPQGRGQPPREESFTFQPGEVPMEMAAEPGFAQPDQRELGREPGYEEPQFPQGYQRVRPVIRRGPVARYHPLDQTGILGSTGILQTRTHLGSTGALGSHDTAIRTRGLLMSTGMLRATGAYRRRIYRPPQTLGIDALGPLPERLPEERAQPAPMPKRRPGQVPKRGQR
jgi:hypothetical protein